MTVELPITRGVLTIQQWDQVEALARTLAPEQARWVSGYFAGLDAGLLSSREDVTLESPPQGRTLSIFYGTETGNGRDLAKALAASATDRGLPAKVSDLADYKVRRLKDEQDVLFVMSTYGEGDPPQPSIAFFEFLESPRAPTLKGLRYSVLALGDSTYEFYCEAGKRIDRRMEELGATRLHPRIDCDIDYEETAAAWSAKLVDLLADEQSAFMRRLPAPATASPTPLGIVHDKRHPFAATVLENIRLVGPNSTKETRHVELDLSGSSLSYQPGDSLGVIASNNSRVVDEILEASALSEDTEVKIKTASISLASALTNRFEITIASPRFVEQWAKLSGADQLRKLVGDEAGSDRLRFLEQHHVIDIIRRFPATGVRPEELLAGLRPLQPRLYSIASSKAVVGEEAHLTVAPVRYQLRDTQRGGVASTQIADRLQMGDTVPVFVQENPHFRLPADDVPIIMIGPGTGVAPFRAFLQEREARAAAGRSWLFFGERNLRSDFLYQLEWQQWLKDGVLTRLDVAFSRDGADKVYVQNRMMECAHELYSWFEEGAHIYVCGDEKNMSRDVHRALVDVIERESGHSRERSEDYVRQLSAEQRYQRDVY